jgi:hypothetical protein
MSQVDSANRTSPESEPKIWKIRAIKNYPEAHNHVLACPIGRGSEPSY